MLDLVEHVVDWSRAAPIQLLCIARPELLDVRPSWGGGKLNATSILLEPLAATRGAKRWSTVFWPIVELDAETRARIVGDRRGQPVLPRGDGGARAAGGGHGRRSADDPGAAAGTARQRSTTASAS